MMPISSTSSTQTLTQPRRWVIGNWKMNPNFTAAQHLAQALSSQIQAAPLQHCHLAIAPTQLHLMRIGQLVTSLNPQTQIHLIAQDVATARQTGAFTGDTSADLLRDAGVEWAIIGHSERRTLHSEDENCIGQKIHASIDADLGVIWCVGESLAEREAGQATAIVTQQIHAHADLLAIINPARLIIAYEPVWAIGTGRSASPADAQEMHKVIRGILTQIRGDLNLTSLLYGGSVKSDNARQLAVCPDINGALVGGASLDADSFLQIAQAFDLAEAGR